MKKFFCLLTITVLTVSLSSGQNDQRAVSILNKFSSAATSAPSVFMKFLIVREDLAENTRDSVEGSVIISKNSYKLDLPDNIIWYNGQTSWSYLPAEQEVTITKPDKKDNSFQSRPSSVFTMYKDNYKNRLVEENKDFYIIDLYPEDLKTELIRVRLTLERPSLDLKTLEYKKKDGTTLFVIVKQYSLKKVPGPDTFTFLPDKYKNVDIIDMR